MPIAHIYNGELGFDVRTKLNALIDQVAAIPVGGGTGDVVGPASALADAVAVYNGTTGKLIKDGGQTIANIIASAVAASGTGDVVGPASAVNARIATYNGITGKLIQDGGMTIADVIAAGGGGGGMSIGGAITSATAGSVLFAGAAGILAQDNTNFFWDDSLNDLHIGGAYYVAAARALYVVPHVTENNWFEGNAGNQTITGYGNFGTGDLALAALTSGYDNVAVGTYAGRFITSGHHNFAMGSFAMWFGQTVNYNTAIGYTALATLGLSGAGGTANENNVAIGNSAMSQVSIAYENVAIGPGTLSGVSAPTTADRNTVIGPSAGAGLGSGGGGTITSNTMVGSAAGYNLTGASSRNTFVGGYRGPSAAVNDACCISSGGGQGLFDLGITKAWTWSLSFKGYSLPTGLHIYNTQDALGSAINYERGIFDWVDVSNVFRIGVEAGGTGVVRPIRWAGLSAKATPIGADSLLLLDSASSGDMKTVLISTLPGGGGGMAIGGAITGGTAGRVLFAGVGGILDDDSTFTWNDTLKDLAIGGAYYVNAAKALFVVPHASGNNWFEGSAGNQTLTGYSNFGTGDGALGVLTSGHFNTALGTHALYSVTTGNSNTAIGQGALGFTVLDNDNFGLGDSALVYLGQSGAGGGANNANVGIGSQAMINLQTGASNVGIGFQSLFSMVSNCNLNVAIGASSGYNVGSGSAAVTRNVFIGADAGVNLTGAALRNTWIGGWRGPAASFNNVSVISDGQYFLFDCHLTTALTYSMMALGFPTGLHIYNTTNTNNSTCLSPTNYERAILDWNATANVFRIGSQKGGTGTVRLIAIDGFSKAGAPAAGDLPASSFAVIDDTAANKTWLAFNKAGVIRQTEIGGTPAGGMAIGGAITGATAGRVLFAGVGGILDDDSTFTWNDSLKDLAIGGAYYVNAARALYVVPHVTENNWFEGNAGNQTVTGFGNFGTGDLALASVTSGVDNVAVGTKALWKATSATQNFAMGSVALSETLSDQYNTAIGYGALWQLGKSGAGGGNNRANVAIGFNALSQAEIAYDNVAIGFAALAAAAPPTAVTENTIIGGNAGSNLGSTGGASLSLNTMIGSHCGYNLTGGTGNAWLGSWHGPAATIYNTIVLSNGYTNGLFVLDCNLTSQFIWSFNMAANTVPACLHIYNKQSPAFTTTNYERAMVGWDINGNNYFRIGSEAGGTGVNRIIIIDAFAKAGAPAAADVLAGSFAVIDDTSAGQTWLVFNKAGTIRKVQLT